jgi:hypothetical protein
MIILFILLVVIYLLTDNIKVINTCISPNYKVQNINENTVEINSQLKEFENKLSHWYPLGEDSFKIDHGSNYFSFFERLGKPTFAVVKNNNNIVGLGIGVLRSVHLKQHRKKKNTVWYICDLKTDPQHRGRGLTIKMALRNLPKLRHTTKVYGVSMNTPNSDNKIHTLTKKIPFVKLKEATTLLIYSLNYKNMLKAHNIISQHRGLISYLNLLDIKDLKLKSTGRPMNLVHVQWDSKHDPSLKRTYYPTQGYTHMFCCPINDPIILKLNELGITTDVTASVLQHNMKKCDWTFIQTSDI